MLKSLEDIAVITDCKSRMPFNRLVKIMPRKLAFIPAVKPFNLMPAKLNLAFQIGNVFSYQIVITEHLPQNRRKGNAQTKRNMGALKLVEYAKKGQICFRNGLEKPAFLN